MFASVLGGSSLPVYFYKRAESWDEACDGLKILIESLLSINPNLDLKEIMLPMRVVEVFNKSLFYTEYAQDKFEFINLHEKERIIKYIMLPSSFLPMHFRYVVTFGEWALEGNKVWKFIRSKPDKPMECLKESIDALKSIKKLSPIDYSSLKNKAFITGSILHYRIADNIFYMNTPEKFGQKMFPREFIDNIFFSIN